ncbi:tripartite tricarboxylate transporter TctB family protein [Pseudokineococcus sp. 1T1Z-3]|uniref:tripartite tricarboxylate transporter TctB family protein n=1 Tax=Pseudokineococcus sp. 1T1Z-3 TaxID=3132745 RepID=UPI0030A5A293
MSRPPSPAPGAAPDAGTDAAPDAGTGPAVAAPEPSRGSFAMAAVALGFAVFLTVGVLVMDYRGDEDAPGPAFFPTLVLLLAWVATVGLAVDAVRERRAASRRVAASADLRDPAGAATADATAGTAGLVEAVGEPGRADAGPPPTAPTDWRAMLLVAGTFAVFVAILVPLGWLVAGTWLFWGVAQALGSRRRLLDLAVGLAIASIVQLAFGAGLGLNLPAGLLGL